MGYVLIFILIIMLFIALLLGNGDLISPWFISCTIYLLSTIVAIVNLNRWGEQIHSITVIIITLGLISFGVGELIIKGSLQVGRKQKKLQFQLGEITVPIPLVIMVFFIGLLICYFKYRRLIEIAHIGGYRGGEYLLNYARIAIIHLNASWGTLLGILMYFNSGASYVFTFSLIVNVILYDNKRKALIKYWYYVLPIIPYILDLIMSTGRNGFIRYLAMILLMSIILWKLKTGWKNKNNIRIVLSSLALLTLLYIIFIQLGNLTGKNNILSIRDSISIYTGSSIVALDKFIDNNNINSKFFGEETLYGIRYILSFIGFDVPMNSSNLSVVHFKNGFSTNVYTALRRYINDYGILGMLIIQFFSGVFFTWFYTIIKKRNLIDIWIIIYCYMANALIMQSIDDSLLTYFLSVSQIFDLLFIIICYKLFIKKYWKNKSIEMYTEEGFEGLM